jgi:hypothetical protein
MEFKSIGTGVNFKNIVLTSNSIEEKRDAKLIQKVFAYHFYHLSMVLKKSLALKKTQIRQNTLSFHSHQISFQTRIYFSRTKQYKTPSSPLNQFPCNHCRWNKTTWLCPCQNPPIINYSYPLPNKDILMVSTRRIYFCKEYFSDKN